MRLGIQPEQLTRGDLHDIPEDVLRAGSTAVRTAGDNDPAGRALATGVARLLDSLAAGGGSLPWLRNYGGGFGYEDHHLYATLALRTAVPMLRALDVISAGENHSGTPR